MRNNPFLFWLLLFVDGAFGADVVKSVSVSVMVGDSVTLHTDVAEIQGAQELGWKIQDENEFKFIAEIDKEINTLSVPGNDEEPFRGRLKLDGQTGSLTITNLKTTDSRVYELQIKNSSETKNKKFSVIVRDDVESVSVMKGDTVTLHTNVTEIQRDDVIQWFGDQGTLIADLNSAADSGWSNIHLNDQTGELTIRNIRRDQNGDYKVEIDTSSRILHKKLRINIISDEAKTVSVKEGETVTLRTGLIEIKGYDHILWKFEDNLMGEFNKATNQLSLYNNADVRFKGRLQLSEKTGSLIISNSKTTDSGVYHLNMSSSSHFLQRTITVTVSDPGHYTSNEALKWGVGILVLVVVVLVIVLIYCCCKKSKPGQQNNVIRNLENETVIPLHNKE